MKPFNIQTERLIIREWVAADEDAFRRLVTAPEVSAWVGGGEEDHPRRPFIERMHADQEEYGWALWAVELRAPVAGVPAGPVGWAGFGTDSLPDPELAWAFHPGVWGRGLATESGIASRDYGFSVLGMTRMVSVVDARNAASARVAAKVGLVHIDTVECHGEPHLLFEIDLDRWRMLIVTR